MKNRLLLIAVVTLTVLSCRKVIDKDFVKVDPEFAKKVERLIAPLYSETYKYNWLPDFEPGYLLVEFFNNETQKLFSRATRNSLRHLHTMPMKKAGSEGIWKMPVSPGTERSGLATIRKRPDVKRVELNVSMRPLQVDSVPNDPNYNPEQMWHLFNMKVQAAWNSGNYGDKNTVTQHIDEPLNPCHPEFVGKLTRNPGEIPGNGVDDDHNGYTDDVEGFNFVNHTPNVFMGYALTHGQHTAGSIIAKGDNNNQVVGVVRNGKILVTPFLGTGGGYIEYAIEAYDYGNMMKEMYPVEFNIGRVTNSWGGGSPSGFMNEAILRAGQKNIGSFFAAGNSSQDQDNPATAMYPAGYAAPPYSNPYIVAVLATTGDERAPFSNYGKNYVHIGAPGVSVLSTLPNGTLGEKSGTSMACPQVAASDQLLESVHPTWTFLQRKDSMMKYVRKVDALIPYCSSAGVIDLSADIYKGVTDHEEPITECLPLPPPPPPPSKPLNYRLFGSPPYGIDPVDGLGFFGNTADSPPVTEEVAGAIVYLDGPNWQWGTYFPSALSGLPIRNYYPYCKRYNSWGDFSISSDTIVVPFAGLPPPVDNLAPVLQGPPTLSDIQTNRITVSWPDATDNIAVAKYYVYRNGSLRDSTTATSYTDVGLTPATMYSYHYTARDAARNISANSTTVQGTTLPITPPPPPTYTITANLSGNPAQVSPVQLTFTVSSTGTIASTHMERKRRNEIDFIPVGANNPTSPFNDSPPPNGNPNWTYRLKVVLSNGQVGYSNTVDVQVRKK